VKIYFDNVNFGASNGPNNYAQKLAHKLTQLGHEIVGPRDEPDAQISFIQVVNKVAPMLLRLDGIYFNSDQDWQAQNAPIKAAYDEADAVVVQSEYSKGLIEHHFGKRDNVKVIHNGTCHDIIEQVAPMNIKKSIPQLAKFGEFWMCAAHWRPHKRLEDNVRYFETHASENAAMLVFGKIDDQALVDRLSELASDRVVYVGDQPWPVLISAMKSCSTFVHLGWLDNCPNVVVDALACGCHLVCSSAGGTKEIPGASCLNGLEWTEVQDTQTFGPCRLYNPPDLDVKNVLKHEISAWVPLRGFPKPGPDDMLTFGDAHSYASVLENMLQHDMS
jgi:glycosyltransferase involved in cell wall biosynthesis